MELMEWAVAYEDAANRTVAIDVDASTETMISTIWEGMAIPWYNGVFETAVLVKGEIIDRMRWRTETEAFEGHASFCQTVLGREPRPEDGWREKRIHHG
jgi:hypothetical protein